MKTACTDLSFLPDGYLARKAGRRTALVGGLLLSLVGIGAAGLTYSAEQSFDQAERQHAGVLVAYNAAAQRLEQGSREAEQQRKAVQRARWMASIVEQVPRSRVLADLSNALPAGASLLSVTFETRPHQEAAPATTDNFDMKRAALESRRRAQTDTAQPAATDVIVKLTAIAPGDVQVGQYLSRLNQSPLFNNVSLLLSEGWQPTPGKRSHSRRFQAQIVLNTDPASVPSREPSPARIARAN